MFYRCFLMLFVCVSSTVVFSGGVCGKPLHGARPTRKQNTIVPELRRKVAADGFGGGLGVLDDSGFFLVSPGNVTPMGSESRYSSASTDALAGSQASSLPYLPTGCSDREKCYVELWFKCRALFSDLYESFRQVHLNFRKRLDLEVQALSHPARKAYLEAGWRQTLAEHREITRDKFAELGKLTKKNDVLIDFARHLFFVEIREISYVYGENSLYLKYLANQRCPTCNSTLPPGSDMRMCYCGGNLILPHNHQELESALTSVHKYLSAFLSQIRQLNKDLRG